MTQTELLASLQAIHAPTDLAMETSDGYIDFSSVDENSERRCFELGSNGDTASMWMTRDELAELHRKLTVLLLAAA